MPPAIHLIAGLPAALVVARYRNGDVLVLARPHDGGRVVVLVDVDQPWRLILSLARPLLWRHERRELARVLLSH